MKNLSVPILIAALSLSVQALAQESRIKLSGFSEVRYTSAFGDPADESTAERFEASGGEEHLIEKGNNISVPGVSLNIQTELNSKLYFQSEVYFVYEHEGLNVHLFRAYADYRISERFNLQAGKFLTPIGYLNRNQRIYSYLNYSVKPRDMVNEEFAFAPLFTIGLQVYGSLPAGNANVNYRVAYGTNRATVPHGQEISVAHIGEEEEPSPGWSGTAELFLSAGSGDIAFGLSGYINPSVKSFLVPEGEDAVIGSLDLRETGFTPYIRIDLSKFQLMGELHIINFEDKLGNTASSSYKYNASSVELLYKSVMAGKALYPYIRYDIRTVDDNHPYYGLVLEHESFLKTHSFSSAEVMAGICWDILEGSRLKVEYGRFTKGPMPINRFSISTSFAF